MKGFNLTPRRRQILYHVAFTHEITRKLERDWSKPWVSGARCHKYRLAGTEINGLLVILRRARLIKFSYLYPHEPILCITPRGMDVLLGNEVTK